MDGVQVSYRRVRPYHMEKTNVREEERNNSTLEDNYSRLCREREGEREGGQLRTLVSLVQTVLFSNSDSTFTETECEGARASLGPVIHTDVWNASTNTVES
eukprot:gene9850-6922_t